MQRILAIDDKMDNLVTLSALLKNLMPDCAMINALSGMEGIAKAKGELPDVILLDVKMPDMDGFETCRRLKTDESTKHIPVIMITAIKTDPQSRIKGLEIGADTFLAKPIDEYELVSQVKVALRIKKAEDALREERDSLERKVQERTDDLRDTETRYRMLFEHSPDGILIVDPTTARPLEFNETAHRQLGYSREEFSGLSIFDLEVAETPEETRSHITQVISARRADFETRQRTRQGEIRNVHVSAQIIEILGCPVYHCVWRDITDRKRAEEKYEMLFREMLDGFALHDIICDGEGRPTDYRFLAINPAFERMTGLRAEEIVGRTVLEVLPSTEQHWIETYGKVALTGKPAFFDSYAAELKKHFEITAFRPALNQFACIFVDITDRKRAEEELQQTLDSLRKAVSTTIQVMVSAIEVRDPYTAGHQTRVAKLAQAIAAEMGFPQEKIDGVRLAGSIHDIGKLSVPAEILSKPTKLTKIEFSLIQEHVQRGFEILKDVESPWPLAEIVLQHHERKDGSGYPRNLKGDEIMMEARILSVADVTESMASHRPYRAGLGIDAALEEIENNRGILYDAEVVDTCLRLFRERGFQL
ncbi:MAG: PAS domain S-box protein [Syntrophales bacterium]|nr:PAS domain S-box protein [Syntrophales bacterium]MCK9390953.1 PAS domain S-box protein [Syntrophales bacterium]